MAIYPNNTPTGIRNLNGLGMTAIALGFFGLAFFWFVPFGMVISLAGLVIGLIGWLLARPRGGLAVRYALGGMALSLMALVVDFIIAGRNLETWTIHSLF